MNKFMQTHKVYLTPLSPIHIGCGEDFEPTNYVIDGNVLYHFEPVKLNLSKEQKEELISLIDGNSDASDAQRLLNIQKFLFNQKDNAKKIANYKINVATGFPKEWKDKISKPVQKRKDGSEEDVINKLAIQRNAYFNSVNGHIPYIAGSSFKGAFITPILSRRHTNSGQFPFIKLKAAKDKNERDVQKKKLDEVNKKIYQDYLYSVNNLQSFEEVKDEFAHNEFRSIKFSDFMPEFTANTKVFYTVNFHRELYKGQKKSDNRIIQRRECILAGQYRVFSADLTLFEDKVNNLLSLDEYFSINQDYYKRAFVSEIEKMKEINLVNEKWANSILHLISQGGYLIRLGKNGSDTKVLEGVAQIKINPKKDQEEYYQEKGTTFWLAADSNIQEENLFPFGWALIEIKDKTENSFLEEWCNQQPKPYLDKFSEYRKMEHKRQEEEAEKLRQEFLASLSNHRREIEEYLNKWKNIQKNNFSSSIMFSESKILIEKAISENWSVEDRTYIFNHLNPDDERSLSAEKFSDIHKLKNNKDKKAAGKFRKLIFSLVAE
ncbi:CRISPR-associated protein [Actinobacillus equuli]|uniref:CRISPR-associated protein n=1 Tax=Actinobacillus equuli TaxID=718 RepID=UPI0024429ADA|nr:CRISPR-associated protein [Actinobacillus equuli]WGE85080.1 CRISPR-associated protein [Actinobacillus equuli subsp. haemolyticus]